MPDGNGNYDWRERMARLKASIERNRADRDRINRNIEGLHASMTAQKENVDQLLIALRELIDRIPPENLRS
ncbi:MAG: hypothetical protein ACR2IV_08625 [Bryobacteraceae bacterium]